MFTPAVEHDDGAHNTGIIEHMFEASWIEGLSAAEAADELARVRELVLVAEATQFALAAH